MPKKILFLGLSGYEYPHVRVRCYRFAKQLSLNGFDTSVLSFHDHLISGVSEEQMYALGDKVKLQLVARSIQHIRKFHPDLVYIQKLHYHSSLAIRYCRLTHTPYVLDYDDYDIGLDHYGNRLFCGFKRSWINYALFGSRNESSILANAARKASACVVASHSLMDLLAPFQKNLFYIPTGTDAQLFLPDPGVKQQEKPVTFIWTGIVWGETIAENLKFIIDALECVRKDFPETRLKIIGQGSSMQSVRDYARTKLPDTSIEFIPWVKPDDIPRVLRESDAGLIALIKKTPWTQSKSPTKLFEYLSTGLPVVASPVGEIPYVIRHGENGLLADTLDEYITCMKSICSDSNLRSGLSKEARRTVEAEYSMKVLGIRLAEIIGKIVN